MFFLATILGKLYVTKHPGGQPCVGRRPLGLGGHAPGGGPGRQAGLGPAKRAALWGDQRVSSVPGRELRGPGGDARGYDQQCSPHFTVWGPCLSESPVLSLGPTGRRERGRRARSLARAGRKRGIVKVRVRGQHVTEAGKAVLGRLEKGRGLGRPSGVSTELGASSGSGSWSGSGAKRGA